MLYFYCVLSLLFIYVFFDVNYFLRAYTIVFSGVNHKKISLNESTTIYGICTFQDCDVQFTSCRLARLCRELDFARYHFYERTGIMHRSRVLSIRSLQGSTFTVTLESVPLFTLYTINTKLSYWDERSLFLEHEVVTVSDGKLRALFVSRQYAIGEYSTSELLQDLPGAVRKPDCPEYIQCWLRSMQISSAKLR